MLKIDKFCKSRLIEISLSWFEYSVVEIFLLSFFQIFRQYRAYTIRVKIARTELALIFLCSCISVCARYSALQIFYEETLGLFTSCFAFMIPSCVCLQMKSEKRKVKREVTGIFNEILSKPLFRYQSRFVKRQKSKYVSCADSTFFLLEKERKNQIYKCFSLIYILSVDIII